MKDWSGKEVKREGPTEEKEAAMPLGDSALSGGISPLKIYQSSLRAEDMQYPVCPDCGRRHPVDPEDDKDSKGWFFHEVVGATREEEDAIWSTLEAMKRGGGGTKDLASRMIQEATKAAEAGNLPKAYLWALITGKVFGLYGV